MKIAQKAKKREKKVVRNGERTKRKKLLSEEKKREYTHVMYIPTASPAANAAPRAVVSADCLVWK